MKTMSYRPNCMQSTKMPLRRHERGRMIEQASSQAPPTERSDGEIFPPSPFTVRNDARGDRVRRRANAEDQARFCEMRALFADVSNPGPGEGCRDRGYRVQFRQ